MISNIFAFSFFQMNQILFHLGDKKLMKYYRLFFSTLLFESAAGVTSRIQIDTC